jgi:hypothetical protein
MLLRLFLLLADKRGTARYGTTSERHLSAEQRSNVCHLFGNEMMK